MEANTAQVLEETPRIIGDVKGAHPGPTIICTGALHGNEPTGLDGIARVLELLEQKKNHFHGRFVGLIGNKAALQAGKRYIDEDLNRIWTPERVREVFLEKTVSPRTSEEVEMLQLATAIDPLLTPSKEGVYYFDLHTTSGPTVPFTWIITETQPDDLAYRLPMPAVGGLESISACAQYIADKGYPVLCAEGGQHYAKESIDHFEAMLIMALELCGNFKKEVIAEELKASKALLEKVCGQLPPRMNVFYIHPIKDGDDFKMRPGYRNFQMISEGEVLAEDINGEIKAPRDCRIMLPLYQKQGKDGFFLAEDFS